MSRESRLTLVDGRLVLGVALDVPGEPLVELIVRVEQRGHDEVEQGPQLRNNNNNNTGCQQLFPTATRALTDTHYCGSRHK